MTLLALTVVGAVLVILALIFRYNSSGQKLAKIPGPKAWPLIGNMFEIVLSNEELFKFVRYMYSEFGDIVRLWSFNKKVINIFSPEDLEPSKCSYCWDTGLLSTSESDVSLIHHAGSVRVGGCTYLIIIKSCGFPHDVFFTVVLSTTKFNQKDEPYVLLQPWLCEGLLVSNGSKWHHRRKLLTPAFHFNILKQFTKVFNAKTDEFLDQLQKEVNKEKTDPHPYINKMTLSTMCETSMGTCLNESHADKREKYFEAIMTLGQCVILRLSRLWLQLDWFFKLTPYYKMQKTALKDVHTFTNSIISERRNQKIDAQNLIDNFNEDDVHGKKTTLAMLDLLLEYERQGKIDHNGIREEVDTFMFEGHDTTAMALFFMTVRLANEPEIQNKIYEELYEIFGESDRSATTNDLNEMKYLELCIKESLRLYPSVPFIARKLNEEVILSGYKIPAKTICAIHIYDVHHRADIYPDPEKFIPERFLAQNVNKRHPYAYIPFSAGPRNCIGQKFAILEMKTVMSKLLRRYKLEPVTKSEDMKFTVDLVLKPLFPFYVRFRNRITT